MLARQYRFHGHNSLRNVYRHGRTIRGAQWSIRYCPNERRRCYRAAIVVSRKVSKSAVVRNRIRRRLYELLREQTGDMRRPYDIVLTVFQVDVSTAPFNELTEELCSQLTAAGIIPKNP